MKARLSYEDLINGSTPAGAWNRARGKRRFDCGSESSRRCL